MISYQVDVPILSNSECNNMFKLAALDEHVSEDIWVCAGYREGGKDACKVMLSADKLEYLRKSCCRVIVGVLSQWLRVRVRALSGPWVV